MTDRPMRERIGRREFTKALGVGAALGLAGCSAEPPNTETQGGGEPNTETQGGGDSSAGGDVPLFANLNPLSGFAAIGGKAIKKGEKLRYKELEQNGGIDGVVPERVFKNDKCSPDTAVGITKSLISKHPNLKAWVGGYCSPTTLATMPLTRQEKILQVVTSAAPGVTEQGHPYIFRTMPGTIGTVPPAVDYALNELDAKRVAILGINNAWGKAQTESWRKLIRHADGAKVVSFNQVPFSQQDYSNEINEIRASNPDLIYALGYHGQTKTMLSQIENFGMTIGEDVNVFIASIAGKVLNQVAGEETLANVYAPLFFIGPIFANFPKEAPDFMVNFVEKWDKEYDAPAIRESATGYAMAETVIQGMKRAGTTTDVPKIADALYNLNEPYVTPLGPLKFKDNGQALMEVFIAQYDDNGQLHRKTEFTSPAETNASKRL